MQSSAQRSSLQASQEARIDHPRVPATSFPFHLLNGKRPSREPPCRAYATSMNLLSVDIVISHDFSSHLISCFSVRGVPKCVCVCEAQDCREADVAVPMGKVDKRVFLDVPGDVLMSFCVAGKALRDIPRV